MTDQIEGRKGGHKMVAAAALLSRQSRKSIGSCSPITRPALGAHAHPALVLRVGAVGVLTPVRIVALSHDAAPIDGHQAGECGMHIGTMQALIVVLPEHLPVALQNRSATVPNA